MKETTAPDPPAALDGIPLLRDLDEPESSRDDGPPLTVTRTRLSNGYGSFTADELRRTRALLPLTELDWSQVVELRRRTSEAITEEAALSAEIHWPTPDRRRPAADGPGHHPAGGR